MLPGSFNPPTRAHVELAHAARSYVDEILFVVPGVFPHKQYFGATLEQRLEMLEAIHLPTAAAVATTDRGLFIEIARECHTQYDPATKLYFLCGRDAAERILTWDYGRSGVVEEMLREFELLVAPRGGDFEPPQAWAHRIHPLGVSAQHDTVSSSKVRELIGRKEPWEHLVPPEIVERVREIYS